MSACCQYETDLTDEPWEVLHPLLPVRQWHPGGPGRPPCDRRRVMTELRQIERRGQGRLAEPSAGAMDRQSVKTATQSQDVGFDRPKKITGRKRHLWVDTLGLIVAVVVTAAHVDAREGLRALWHSYCADGVTRLRQRWVDGGYRAEWLCAWVWSLKRTPKIDLEVVEHTGTGFRVVPHRWVVERTCAWRLNDRRHRCDYETLTATREAMIQISMIHL